MKQCRLGIYKQGPLLLWVLLLIPCWADASANILLLKEAELAIIDSTTPPLDANWQKVSLPHRWQEQDYANGRNGWYRLTFNLTDEPTSQWGIYLQRFNMNAAIFLNGHDLGSSGSFDEPLSRNWNRPLYIATPPALWQAGENTLHIRLKSYAAYGHLSTVTIGPDETLKPQYQLQHLIQTDISAALFPLMLAIGLLVLSLWVRRHQDSQYLWFALAVFTWAVFSLNMFVKDQPFPTHLWEWIAHSSVDWWAILLAIFAYRFTHSPRPILERVYLAYGVIASTTYAVVDLKTLATATLVFHSASLVIGVILVWHLFQTASREHNKVYAQLASALLLLLLISIHDWLFQFKIPGVGGEIGLHINHYYSPLIFLFMAWHLSGRFVSALNESENLNRELESRIEEARDELDRHYKKLQTMEKNQAIHQERERLSREIHDGVSGNISNAIMMTELIRRRVPGIDQERLFQLRSHLDDGLSEIRNLILTMEEELSTINELFNHINDKYEHILTSLDIDYHSTFDTRRPQLKLDQKQCLNLLRILQEALNNIVKHAEPSAVTLSVSDRDDAILFQVCDNGLGFDNNNAKAGHYGQENMKRRAVEIGAKLTIESEHNRGTTISLEVPLKSSERGQDLSN